MLHAAVQRPSPLGTVIATCLSHCAWRTSSISRMDENGQFPPAGPSREAGGPIHRTWEGRGPGIPHTGQPLCRGSRIPTTGLAILAAACQRDSSCWTVSLERSGSAACLRASGARAATDCVINGLLGTKQIPRGLEVQCKGVTIALSARDVHDCLALFGCAMSAAVVRVLPCVYLSQRCIVCTGGATPRPHCSTA